MPPPAKREQTSAHPSTPRSAWVERERGTPEEIGGWVEFEYEVYGSVAAQARGERPFLIVNHRAQFRETHQRVRVGPNGGMMHVLAGEVLDLEAFEGDPLYRRFTADWHDQDGQAWAPFIFPAAPWAGGHDEELDPQWEREIYVLPIREQVEKAKQRRLRRAELRRESGDKRGTTLNLQVGASADDAYQEAADNVAVTGTFNIFDSTTEHIGCRFTGVTIDGTATIDNAIFQVWVTSGTGDEPLMQLRGEDVDNAAQFTSDTNNIDARTRTTATVNWNDTDLGLTVAAHEEWGCTVAGGAGLTVETIIQEIIDRAGWASGNAVVLIAEQSGAGSSTRDLSINFYDANSAQAALLDIDYTVPTTGTAALVLPFPIMSAVGNQRPKGTSSLTLPFPVMTGAGTAILINQGTGALVLPFPVMTAAGLHTDIQGSGALVLPFPVMTAAGSVDALGVAALVLPFPVMTAAGVMLPKGTAALVLPFPVMTAAGLQSIDGTGALVLPFPIMTAVGERTLPGTSSLILPFPILTASGLHTDIQATASLVLPFPVMSAAGFILPRGTAALVLPFPIMTASGAQVVHPLQAKPQPGVGSFWKPLPGSGIYVRVPPGAGSYHRPQRGS